MTEKRAGYISTAGVIHRLLEMEGAATASIVRTSTIRHNELTQRMIEVMRKADEWTIPEIIRQVDPSQAKAIRGAVDYLARSGRLQRLARGHYRVVRLDAGRGMSREETRNALVLRAYADMFNLARRKIEDLQDELVELRSRSNVTELPQYDCPSAECPCFNCVQDRLRLGIAE